MRVSPFALTADEEVVDDELVEVVEGSGLCQTRQCRVVTGCDALVT